MHELPSDRFPGLIPLFHRELPNHPMLLATLNGKMAGAALVDDLGQPAAAAVRIAFGMTFVGGAVTQGFLDEALRLFVERSKLAMLVWPEPPVRIAGLAPPPDAKKIYPRRELYDLPRLSARLTDLAKDTPSGSRLVPFDAEILERCRWRGVVMTATGGVEAFLEHVRGVFLIADDGTVLCEAYGLFEGEEQVEIGVITHPDHRGRGLATRTCARLILDILNEGLETTWSCELANHASLALAGKLGYRQHRDYAMIDYGSSPPKQGA